MRHSSSILFTLGLLLLFAANLKARTQSVPQGASTVHDGPWLFRERGCIQCHQIRGVGGHKGPDLSGVGRRLKKEAIHHQIISGGGAMPAFGEALPSEEIDTLVKYLQHRKDKLPAVTKPAPTPVITTAPPQ